MYNDLTQGWIGQLSQEIWSMNMYQNLERRRQCSVQLYTIGNIWRLPLEIRYVVYQPRVFHRQHTGIMGSFDNNSCVTYSEVIILLGISDHYYFEFPNSHRAVQNRLTIVNYVLRVPLDYVKKKTIPNQISTTHNNHNNYFSQQSLLFCLLLSPQDYCLIQ